MKYEEELKPVTMEQLHEWMSASAAMPKAFTVVDALVLSEERQIIVKWMNDEDYDIYQDAIADSRDPNAAKRAYQFEPTYSYSRIWLNQSEDGRSFSPVCDVMSQEELVRIKRELGSVQFSRPRNTEAGIVAWTTKKTS